MRLPILLYHEVDAVPVGARHVGNFVEPRQFEHQIGALERWGYSPVGLEEWVAARRSGHALPARPIALTFDDGYRSFLEHAFPVLERAGWHATVFAVTGQVGGTNVWDTDEVRRPLLDAEEMRQLRRAGIRFGSHTRSHRPLARIPPSEAETELRESKRDLEALLGERVTTLAYPFNNQSRRVRRLARDAGYETAVMGRGRTNSRHRTLLGLFRIKVDLTTTPETLHEALTRPQLWPW